MSLTAARTLIKARTSLSTATQRRTFVDWMTNYPDKVSHNDTSLWLRIPIGAGWRLGTSDAYVILVVLFLIVFYFPRFYNIFRYFRLMNWKRFTKPVAVLPLRGWKCRKIPTPISLVRLSWPLECRKWRLDITDWLLEKESWIKRNGIALSRYRLSDYILFGMACYQTI